MRKRLHISSRPFGARHTLAGDPPAFVVARGGVQRLVDLLVCLFAVPFLLPIMAVIAILIKLDSEGPVFYLGERTGLGGRPFRIIKFRTMVQNAEKIGGGTTALHDPRVTRVGQYLRRFKLDELPQIFNVIKGEMSLVGPRPELPQYTALYQGDERLILTVRPGITDYSSIEFSTLDEVVGEQDADAVYEAKVLARKNQLRVQYVKERTFVGDLVIILRTFACLLKKWKT
jgi:lipopolysaccharide/colanic/teichoic acid biosynthesis glycosyltransferase